MKTNNDKIRSQQLREYSKTICTEIHSPLSRLLYPVVITRGISIVQSVRRLVSDLVSKCLNQVHLEQATMKRSMPALSDTMLERYSFVLEHGQTGKPLDNPYLSTIGNLVKTSRLRNYYSRTQFARELGMTPEQILFLEAEIGLEEDISREGLVRLLKFLTRSEQDLLLDTLHADSEHISKDILHLCRHSIDSMCNENALATQVIR